MLNEHVPSQSTVPPGGARELCLPGLEGELRLLS